MKEGHEVLGKSEGVAPRVLSYFLTDNGKDVYLDRISPGTGTQTIDLKWLYVVTR